MATRQEHSRSGHKSVAVPLEAMTEDEPEPRSALGTREIDRISRTSIATVPRTPWSLASGVLDPEAVALPVFVIGEDGRIEDVNTLAEALVGYSHGELVGQAMEQIISSPAGDPLVTGWPAMFPWRSWCART